MIKEGNLCVTSVTVTNVKIMLIYDIFDAIFYKINNWQRIFEDYKVNDCFVMCQR